MKIPINIKSKKTILKKIHGGANFLGPIFWEAFFCEAFFPVFPELLNYFL